MFIAVLSVRAKHWKQPKSYSVSESITKWRYIQTADIRGLSEKSPTIVNVMKWFVPHQCHLAAKESGLECACMNNDDFSILVSGDGRCH